MAEFVRLLEEEGEHELAICAAAGAHRGPHSGPGRRPGRRLTGAGGRR
ncbi:hypothetical protein ACIBTP_06310 [Streptomyces avidinii]